MKNSKRGTLFFFTYCSLGGWLGGPWAHTRVVRLLRQKSISINAWYPFMLNCLKIEKKMKEERASSGVGFFFLEQNCSCCSCVVVIVVVVVVVHWDPGGESSRPSPPSSLDLFSFFHFMRRFWNQILIWRSVRHSAWAISIRLLRVR